MVGEGLTMMNGVEKNRVDPFLQKSIDNTVTKEVKNEKDI